jgi:hypothetical protein
MPRKRKPKCIKVGDTLYRPDIPKSPYAGSCNGCAFWERPWEHDPSCADFEGDPPCGRGDIIYKRVEDPLHATLLEADARPVKLKTRKE